jgi:hypothetical protein
MCSSCFFMRSIADSTMRAAAPLASLYFLSLGPSLNVGGGWLGPGALLYEPAALLCLARLASCYWQQRPRSRWRLFLAKAIWKVVSRQSLDVLRGCYFLRIALRAEARPLARLVVALGI